ncbi:hypothetical protein Ae201684P_004544 [Aphanomyces euteiches]|uniref:Chromo domain-containing protein n=1 Tax=Aphanomyces euteiches TaxID=100861 RepID=A0A6G0XCR4_9STRA|nr:hypothetical protein Ae201684_006261 [Aphanomyces euteiches]KAH9068845.1 hypothetical protein Ae201684P_004544 [Aphanomyces euteiches]
MARDELHRGVALQAKNKRDCERNRRNAKKGVQKIQFDIGVLVGAVTQANNKLLVQWLGPRRIVNAISDWVFCVEDLRDGSLSTHHASRLKKFAAKDLNVSQALLDHIAYVEVGYLVEDLRDCKFDRVDKTWKILVKWFGLAECENSWEPASILLEDVPRLVHQFVKKSAKNSNAAKIAAALSLLSSPTD